MLGRPEGARLRQHGGPHHRGHQRRHHRLQQRQQRLGRRFYQALQKLKNDLDDLGKNSKNTDVAKAITDLNTQVGKVQQAINDKQAPDLKPLGDAAYNLTQVCTG